MRRPYDFTAISESEERDRTRPWHKSQPIGVCAILTQREQNKLEKRTRIINAAIRIIHKDGIDALTMRHLADEAGVSSRTPYNLFTSKTDILFAIMMQSTEPLGNLEQEAQHGLAVAKLFQRLEALGALDEEAEPFYRSIHWSIMRSDDLEAKRHARQMLESVVAEHIDNLSAQRELKPDSDTAFLTRHLAILLAAIVGMWADSQLTLEQTLDHTREAWRDALLPHSRGKAQRYLQDVQQPRH